MAILRLSWNSNLLKVYSYIFDHDIYSQKHFGIEQTKQQQQKQAS